MNRPRSVSRSFVAAPWWGLACLALLAAGVLVYRTSVADDEPPKKNAPEADAKPDADPDEKPDAKPDPKSDAKPDESDAKPDDKHPEEPAIRAAATTFIAAFNKGDAAAVAAHWTPAGALTDETGALFEGREAIQKEYAAFFEANPEAKLSIRIESIAFPAPTVAIEDGVAQVVAKGQAPAACRYTAVHVLEDGQWRMATVRESGIDLLSSGGRLQGLASLVGDWKTTGDDATVEMSFRWIAGRSFLEQTHSVTRDGIVTGSGTQIIGWDPEAGRIRSWSFESTGGFGESLWTETEDGWQLESRGVLADGTPTSSHEFLIRVPGEDHVLGWRSIDRQAGADRLPDTDEVVLDRVTR